MSTVLVVKKGNITPSNKRKLESQGVIVAIVKDVKEASVYSTDNKIEEDGFKLDAAS